MTPGAKFSTRMSARATSSRKSALPFSDFRLSVTGFLFELSIAKGRSAPPRSPRLRRCSPWSGSILITFAPANAIRNAAYGPRSEERRVGKECRCGRSVEQEEKEQRTDMDIRKHE